MNAIEQLLIKVFTIRGLAHAAHLKTKSFAQHKALEEFYTSIIDQVDELIEVYQGLYGLVRIAPLPLTPQPDDIVATIQTDAEWITTNRSSIALGQPMLENLVDGLAATYYRTLYKLKNLR